MAKAIARAKQLERRREREVDGSVRFREGAASDAPALAALSSEAFPTSLRWLSPSAGRAWWRGALASERAVVRLAEDEDGLLGFVIVHDGAGWTPVEHVGRLRMARELLTVRAAALAPRIALRGLVRRLRYRGASGDAPAPGPAAWLELIGVAGRARGRGVGRALLAFADDAARSLGLGVTRLRVDIDNEPARRMYERGGWTLLRTVGDSCHYERRAPDEGEREAP